MQSSYYIFGAHSRGQTTSVYLKALYPERKFLGFLYANEEKNPDCIDGNPVIKLREGLEGLDLNAAVYIATRGIYHNDISKGLEKCGFKEIIPVDMELDIELRNRFIPDYFKKLGRDFTRLESVIDMAENAEACNSFEGRDSVYVVRSAVDSPLSKDVPLRSFEKYIQAGSALTDLKVGSCDLFDSTGDNISDKNYQMCELTAMYWIWKNIDKDIVGLEHYRRRFILPENWSAAFTEGGIDVILPVPLYVHPSLTGNFCQRHVDKVWNAMFDSIKCLYPEQYQEAKDFFDNTAAYSPCNILIARKSAFDDMCAWLFPILFDVMDSVGHIDDTYQNRYPGFVSERLITFYFYMKRQELKVAYADKTFLA